MELAPLIASGYNEVVHGLTEQEQMFLYQLEVVGLPVVRAGEIAGVSSPYSWLKKPHIVAAREQYRAAVRGRTDFSRDDIVAGIKEAIDQGKMLGDPMAQIAGWREIAKLKGFDKTPNININLTGTEEQIIKQVRAMPTSELLRISGGESALDADFYRVSNDVPADEG